MQEYDASLKLLFQSAATQTRRVLTGTEVVSWLNIELPKVQNRQVDLLGQTADGELLHIELQSTNDAAMPLRMAEYFLAIHRHQGKAPRQLVIYVGQKPLTMAAEMIAGGMQFRYDLVDMRDVDGEPLLASPQVSDNVLAILGRLSARGDAVRQVVARIAGLSPDASMRYLRLLLVIAGLRGMEEFVEREVGNVPVYIDILENKVLGREYKKGELSVLRRLIEKRFGALPPWAEQRITEASVDQIETWAVALLDATSLEELLKEPTA